MHRVPPSPAFELKDFKAFMLAQSRAFPETIELARALARTGRYRLMTINNESAELNQHRLEQFGLRDMFTTFFSSCWVGVLKPARRIYEVALAMSQAIPENSVFIDDREQNLAPARELGMKTIRFTDASQPPPRAGGPGRATLIGDRSMQLAMIGLNEFGGHAVKPV